MNDPRDQQPIRSVFEGDPEMGDLVRLFVEELPDRISRLRQAFQAGEFEYLRVEAHRLKGAAPGYGFLPIGDAAERLESILLQGADHAALADEADRIRDEFESLVNLCSRAAA